MKLKVTLLLALGIIPFALLMMQTMTSVGIRLPGNGLLSSDGVYFFGLNGLLWCALFTYSCVRAEETQRRKLVWMLPLVLFAFGLPAFYLFLWIANIVTIVSGGAPM